MKSQEIEFEVRGQKLTLREGDYLRVKSHPIDSDDVRYVSKEALPNLRAGKFGITDLPKLSQKEWKRLKPLLTFIPDNKNRWIRRYYLKK